MARVVVVGAGYVGLVTAAGFAELGHSVAALETDPARLELLLAGELPIHEPGLDELVRRGREAGRLEFGSDYAAVVPGADHVFLAVHTPPNPDGTPDTRFVMAAVRMVLAHARPGLTIVTKSTVPVGTADEIDRLVRGSGHAGIAVVSNPEFVREGSAVEDFLRPDRIVVGTLRTELGAAVAALYEPIEAPVLLVSRRSAEVAKYAANAALASRISFINEIAAICGAVGADVSDVAGIVGADRRIGPSFLQAGLGWGGSCFPKDVLGLVSTADRFGVRTPLLEATIEVNDRQRDRAVDLLLEAAAGHGDATVAILGLAFKPHTDDLRGSPALDIARRLRAAGVGVRAHDPHAMAKAQPILPDVTYATGPYDAATGADALLLATEWPAYLELDWPAMARAMRGRTVVDGRNVLPGGHLTSLGFDYHAYGRATAGSLVDLHVAQHDGRSEAASDLLVGAADSVA